MKKTLSYIIIAFLTAQMLLPFWGVQTAYAVTDSYDFDDDTTYALSDTTKTYIHGGSAKLKWSLAHRWHLENGPAAMDQPTRVIIDGNYAYVSGYGSHAVTSIDISDPTNMSAAGYIWSNGNRRIYNAYDLVKSWNYVYAVSYTWDAVEIIDASNPTNLKHETKVLNTAVTKLNWARAIDVVGNFAYVASYIDDALQIIDITDPTAPVTRWFIQDNLRLNWANDVKVVWDYAYVVSYLSDRFQVIDISDPDTPVFVAEIIDDWVTELRGAWRLDVEWDYAYVAAYTDDGLSVIDISNPLIPSEVGSIQNSDPWVFLNGARDVTVVGNYAYVAAYADDSLEIVDISVPSNPTHVWRLDTASVNGRLDAANSVAVSGTDVFVVSYTNSTMQSIDASNPTLPAFQGEFESGPARLWNPVGIEVDGDYAYIWAYGSSTLEIVDISDSSNPVHAWSISDNSSANELWWSWDVAKKWDYVYVSGYGDRWLETIDVSNPANPVSTSTIVDSATVELQNPRGSYIQWNYLYVVSYYGDSLQIFDITIPATPVPRWFYKDGWVLGTPNDVVVKWNYAFISDYTGDKIVVVDVSDPDAPVYETQIVDGGIMELNGAWDLRVDGDYLYVVAYIDDAIVILDISDPTNPTYMWDLDNDPSMRLRRPRGLVFDEWYAYLTSYSNDSVVAFDVSDPTDPIFIDQIYDTNLYDTSTAIDKKDNDLFFTQYQWSSLSVVRESYPSDSPYIIPDNAIDSNYFNSMTLNLWTYNEWTVSFQLSKDDGVTWYYYNGGAWVATAAGSVNSNDVTTINTNIAWFNTLPGTGDIKWKAFLNSDGSQKVEIDQIVIDYFDSTPPIIDDTFPKADDLLPKHDFDITLDYFDVDGAYGSGAVTENNWWVGIDTSSAVLKLSKWDGTTWGADIAGTYINFSGSTVGTWSANYPTLDIPYGKYEMYFSIDDLNGNSTSTGVVFYVDEPEFIVSDPIIDIGEINDSTATFSDTVTLTVKTVWAWFDVTMDTPFPTLIYTTESLWAWDGSTWFGYDLAPYSSSITAIGADELVATQVKNINTDGDKNTYTYDLKLWAISELMQAGGDYLWNIDFGINLTY